MAISRFRLDGSLAMITGNGRGIGTATAPVFADVGASIFSMEIYLE